MLSILLTKKLVILDLFFFSPLYELIHKRKKKVSYTELSVEICLKSSKLLTICPAHPLFHVVLSHDYYIVPFSNLKFLWGFC